MNIILVGEESAGPGVKVACGDEWVIVNKLRVEGRYVNSAEVLEHGSRLIESPRG